MEQPFEEAGEVWTDKQLLYYLVVSSPSINEQRLEERGQIRGWHSVKIERLMILWW